MQSINDNSSRAIYSVTQLTTNIKVLLENKYRIIWLSGEISNIHIPASGHAYFSLKDNKAQISAVMFKGQLRHLKFRLENGAAIVGMGRISVYEPRGTYQIILEYVEPHGAGALQIAFEQLKQKLDTEGLFHPSHKKELPFLPEKIGLITSPTGAVIKDILRVASRRFQDMNVDIFPVRVQGDGAVREITRAIALANDASRCDVIIIARGGGSFEDMAAFNSEAVARAIFASNKPVVSAIGHETDFSLADFVADLRAPTPSAAAEMAIPVKSELQARCMELRQRSRRAVRRSLEIHRLHIDQIQKSMPRIIRKLQDHQLRTDDLVDRLFRANSYYLQRQQARFDHLHSKLLLNIPDRYIYLYKSKLELWMQRIKQNMMKKNTHLREQLKTLQASLNALNPTAILKRGYSITRALPQGKIVTDPKQVDLDDHLEIQLAQGPIVVTVLHKPKTES